MSLLVAVVIVCAVCGLVFYLGTLLPAPFGRIVQIVAVVIAIIWLLLQLPGVHAVAS